VSNKQALSNTINNTGISNMTRDEDEDRDEDRDEDDDDEVSNKQALSTLYLYLPHPAWLNSINNNTGISNMTRDEDRDEDEDRDDDDDDDDDDRNEICEYIHFDDVKECIEFIQYIKKLNYEVGHTCCGGLGCKIKNIDNSTAHRIKKEFLAIHLLVVEDI
jgi:hypothetical protein